jgi:flagellar hook-associated protein 3 FlgL
MRVSTSQFYLFSSNNMSRLQSDVTDQAKYISSGKQVLTAKDAPIDNLVLQGFKEELLSQERFSTNLVKAENRNTRQEVVLSSAQDVLIQAQGALLQANNAGYSDEEFHSLGQELRSSYDQLLELANTKSEREDYIFGGYSTTQRPFSAAPDNSVTYLGDTGQSQLQIAHNIQVSISLSGQDVFLGSDNAVGDFMPSYTDNLTPAPIGTDPDQADIYVDRAVIVDRQAYNAAAMQPGFTFDFNDANGDGVVEATVTDAAGTVVYPATDVVPGDVIAFNGMEVNIDGSPLPGDQFSLAPQQKNSVFDTLKQAIDWVEGSGAGLTDAKQHQVDFNHLVTQLTEDLSHITNKRAQVGTTLKQIDVQREISLDNEVMLQTARGKIEDLDYAHAISAFEQQKVSLQAAQQTFSQIQGLSLFNFI